MPGVLQLLRQNRNYRFIWSGQLVSEIGDHFNNIAVFALALDYTGSGMSVAGVMLSRAIPAVMAGPLAGVTLDRLNRKWIMITSDLVRALLALGFILALYRHEMWILYVCSALLMFASPFFTSGRSAILPTIVTEEELHTANSVTQTTQWLTTCIGAFLGGTSVAHFGYEGAFVLNAFSFIFSALCIMQLRATRGEFRVTREATAERKAGRVSSWHEYKQGLSYLYSIPLLFGIAMLSAGWATGGGAAQILFSLFGEIVFKRGPQGIGMIWGAAGFGLVLGGIFAHRVGPRLTFNQYRASIAIVYILHGLTYVAFSNMTNWYLALLFICLSRASVAISSVLNTSQLLQHVANEYRGRVFATIESITWSVMMISLAVAGIASQHYSPRVIGTVAGLFGAATGCAWAWAIAAGKLPEPARSSVSAISEATHGEQLVKTTR